MTPDPADLALTIQNALRMSQSRSARSRQQEDGILGPSDIGFCRQAAALTTRGVERTDSRSMWPAQVGTFIHNGVEAALAEVFPDWKFGSIDGITVTATLPSGAQISGHPDIIAPDMNAILDIKTVDGLDGVKRRGSSQSYRYQRHLYALGAIDAGLLDGTQTVYVGNVFMDRSGVEETPYVTLAELDPTLTDEIDQWISDVVYAVKHGEDAARDVAAPICERICDFYTACRGGLPASEGIQITDPELVDAVAQYVEGRQKEAEGARLKRNAKSVLYGITGTTDEYEVRWTNIPPSERKASFTEGYLRLDISKIGGRKR